MEIGEEGEGKDSLPLQQHYYKQETEMITSLLSVAVTLAKHSTSVARNNSDHLHSTREYPTKARQTDVPTYLSQFFQLKPSIVTLAEPGAWLHLLRSKYTVEHTTRHEHCAARLPVQTESTLLTPPRLQFTQSQEHKARSTEQLTCIYCAQRCVCWLHCTLTCSPCPKAGSGPLKWMSFVGRIA